MKLCSTLAFCLLLTTKIASAQSSLNIPYGAPGMLNHFDDARGIALGGAGAALSSDATAAYWNVGKLANAKRDFGVAATYGNWLPNLVNDSWLGHVHMYKKLGEKQAVGLSANYFTSGPSMSVYDYTSRDLAIGGSYSRQLGKHFSMGVTFKYISSSYSGNLFSSGAPSDGQDGAAAVDFGFYYHHKNENPVTGAATVWSAGLALNNLGGEIRYLGADYYLPANLRLGGAFSHTSNGIHKINLLADLNKLMVPTIISTGFGTTPDPALAVMLRSFSDAPGGLKEELQEIQLNVGAEYWFKDIVALRAGYFAQNRNKGDWKMLTTGAGLMLRKSYGVDFAYSFDAKESTVRGNFFRLTLSAYLGREMN